MLAEMIEKIKELDDKAKLHTIEGRVYVDGELTLVKPPLPQAYQLMTLTGLADFVAAYPDGLAQTEWFLDVVGHGSVAVRGYHENGYGQRHTLATCELEDGERFAFGQFLDREAFVIGLMSRFVETPELTQLLALVSSLSNEGVTQSEDDGISQKTTVKQGITLKSSVTVKGRWTLQPYRTFREIEQPASQFVLRLRAEAGQVPTCALFEADGGRWKLDAVLAIKEWLAEKNLGLNIVA